MQTKQRYQELCQAIKRRQFPDNTIKIIVAFDVLPNRFPPTEVGMVKKVKQARTNYMAFIIKQQKRGELPSDHPILWLDADTTFIDESMVPLMLHALKQDRAHFVKGHLLLTVDASESQPSLLRNTAEHVATLFGATKSELEEQLEMYEPRDYVEECGLAFKLSSYIQAGGLAYSRGPVQGETRVLLGRARKRLDPSIPMVCYLADALHGTSHRRIYALAHTVPAYDIPDYQFGNLYQLCSNIEVDPLRQISVTAGDVVRMIDKMIEDHIQAGHRPLTKAQYHRLIRLVYQLIPDSKRLQQYGVYESRQPLALAS